LNTFSIDYKVKIASLGGIEAILDAMSAHLNVVTVQERAFGALNDLKLCDGITRFSVVTSSGYIPFRL
jgi:hypothetical protein